MNYLQDWKLLCIAAVVDLLVNIVEFVVASNVVAEPDVVVAVVVVGVAHFALAKFVITSILFVVIATFEFVIIVTSIVPLRLIAVASAFMLIFVT